MGEKGAAFVKGGFGCLAAFVVLALLAVIMGGSAHIDVGGACMLFSVGGLLGLLVYWIYNKGRAAPPNVSPGGFEVIPPKSANDPQDSWPQMTDDHS